MIRAPPGEKGLHRYVPNVKRKKKIFAGPFCFLLWGLGSLFVSHFGIVQSLCRAEILDFKEFIANYGSVQASEDAASVLFLPVHGT